MKYLVIIITVVTLASAGAVAYLYINPGSLHSISNDKIGSQATSDQSKDLSSGLNKLQNELTNLKDVLARQSLSIQELSRQSGIDRDRIVSLEKKLQSLSSTPSGHHEEMSEPAKENNNGKTDLSGTSYQSFSPELFNNPEFAKLFRDKVDQAIKDIQQEERDARTKQMNEQAQQRIVRIIDGFAKAQNLNDYQKQELSKIITDRLNKNMELANQVRSPDANREELRTKMETLRNESNEKVKSILLPQQYEEYKKIESQFGVGRVRMPGQRPAPQTPPR